MYCIIPKVHAFGSLLLTHSLLVQTHIHDVCQRPKTYFNNWDRHILRILGRLFVSFFADNLVYLVNWFGMVFKTLNILDNFFGFLILFCLLGRMRSDLRMQSGAVSADTGSCTRREPRDWSFSTLDKHCTTSVFSYSCATLLHLCTLHRTPPLLKYFFR